MEKTAFQINKQNYTQIANKFALAFKDAVKNILQTVSTMLLNKDEYSKPADVTFYLRRAEPKNIEKIIKNLKSNKAIGNDGIKVIDIKLSSKNISGSIAQLINASIKFGSYPNELKQSCSQKG